MKYTIRRNGSEQTPSLKKEKKKKEKKKKKKKKTSSPSG